MENYFELYDVSIDGVVFNKRTGHVKVPFKSDMGYLKVQLFYNGKKHNVRVHRMIALKYIPNPMNHSVINHIDGNKLNNSIDNLEWCTIKHNVEHANKTGLTKIGVESGNAKLNREDVLNIRKRRANGEKQLSVYEDYKDKIGWWSFRDVIRGDSYKSVK